MAENPRKYNTAFKSLSDADPRGLLDIFGVLPHGAEAEVEPLPRDIAARPLVVDSGYFVRPAKGAPFIAVFEALTSWKPEIGGRLASYGAALGDKYKMRIRVYPLPMAPQACPKNPPAFGRATWGDVEVVVRLRWIKPWKINASVVLDRRSVPLDAWAVLFERNDVQTDEILARLMTHRDDFGTFRILGGLRYGNDDSGWEDLVRRIESMLTRDQMRESRAVQEWLQEGRQEGRQEGEARGTRFALVTFIEGRFPNLKVRDEVESISDLDLLHSLFSTIVKAPNSAAVLRAIRKAATSAHREGASIG